MNNKKVTIIAEAGVNHNGDINIAKKLIDVASDAGADYVKFQTFKSEELVSQTAKKADYQIKNMSESLDENQFEMLKKLELSQNDHQILIDYTKSKNIKFLSTAFDIKSINFLDSLKLELIKVPSGEITNYTYLKEIAKKQMPIILSTGMADIKEIKSAMDILLANGVSKDNITILHCNTEYPTPMKDVNLHAMLTIKDIFKVKVGYSDHTEGVEVSVAAVALGASVIEKHFTLDKNFPGPDHKASLNPEELKSMVKQIRNIEQAISGDGEKKPSESEIKNKDIVRKSIHLSKNVKKGQKISENLLICLRPGDGISPMEIPLIIGKSFAKDLKSFSKLKHSDIYE
tara:strand:+ start:3287 stop:4321 length:1035 start_codon:yes stop_codon:yes gene_type:complete